MRGVSMVVSQGFLLRGLIDRSSLLRRAFSVLGSPAGCSDWCTGRRAPEGQVFIRGLGPLAPLGVGRAGLLMRMQRSVESLLGRPVRGVVPLRCRRVRGVAVEVGEQWMRGSVTLDVFSFGAGVLRLAFPLPREVGVEELVALLRGGRGLVRWRGSMVTQRGFFSSLHRLVLESLFSSGGEGKEVRRVGEALPHQWYIYLAGVGRGAGASGEELSQVLEALTFLVVPSGKEGGRGTEILTKGRWGVRRGEHIVLSKRGAVVVSPVLEGSSGREARKRLRGMLEWLGGLAQLQAAWLDGAPLSFEAASSLPQEALEDLLVILAVPLNPDILLGQAARTLLPSAAWRSAYRRYAQSFSLMRRWDTAWNTVMQLAQGTIAVRCGDLLRRLLRLQARTLTSHLRSLTRVEAEPLSLQYLQVTYQLSEGAALVLRALLHAYIVDVRSPGRRLTLGERSRRELGEMSGLGRAIYGRRGRVDPIAELCRRGLAVARQGKGVGREGRVLFARLNTSNPVILKLLARIDPSLLE